MWGLGRHWGEISSSSWGKETIRDRVTPPDKEVWAPKRNQREEPMRGTNERMGGRPQAQENKSKLIQANKTLKMRDRVLTATIRRCHIELAKRKNISEIEASKDAVHLAPGPCVYVHFLEQLWQEPIYYCKMRRNSPLLPSPGEFLRILQ